MFFFAASVGTVFSFPGSVHLPWKLRPRPRKDGTRSGHWIEGKLAVFNMKAAACSEGEMSCKMSRGRFVGGGWRRRGSRQGGDSFCSAERCDKKEASFELKSPKRIFAEVSSPVPARERGFDSERLVRLFGSFLVLLWVLLTPSSVGVCLCCGCWNSACAPFAGAWARWAGEPQRNALLSRGESSAHLVDVTCVAPFSDFVHGKYLLLLLKYNNKKNRSRRGSLFGTVFLRPCRSL
ncbi:unnamed protein product [Ectocarpus sp. 6 AP-2014]